MCWCNPLCIVCDNQADELYLDHVRQSQHMSTLDNVQAFCGLMQKHQGWKGISHTSRKTCNLHSTLCDPWLDGGIRKLASLHWTMKLILLPFINCTLYCILNTSKMCLIYSEGTYVLSSCTFKPAEKAFQCDSWARS